MLTLKRSDNLTAKLEKKVFSNPEAKAIYEAFSLQLELAAKMKKARQKAQLTQAQVAKKMGTKTPAVSRLESSILTKKMYSPSIITLVKYAHAIGKELKINFINAA